MSGRLGVAIGATEVRAVVVESDRIVWCDAAPIDGAEDIGAALESVLARRPRHAGTKVGVVIGPSWVQVKRIAGIPPLRSATLATQLVRENQRAFFLSAGRSELAIETRRERDGTVWAAAFAAEVLRAVDESLRAAGLRVRAIVPSLVAVAAITSDGPRLWRDGDHAFELASTEGRLTRVDRVFAPSGDEAGTPDEARYHDAYAAALCSIRAPFAWRRARHSRARHLRIAANVVAYSLLAAAAAFSLIGPAIRQSRFVRAARSELGGNRAAMSELARVESDLRAVNARLGRIERFRSRQGRITQLLGELSQALPESTAILNVRVDSMAGAFSAISPNVAAVLPDVAEYKLFNTTRLVGSITTEAMGGAQVQRAAFRFRRPDALIDAPRRAR